MGAWIEIIYVLEQSVGYMSLPSWERGLKLIGSGLSAPVVLSLPSWERGLKCKKKNGELMLNKSLPSWERGLKLANL